MINILSYVGMTLQSEVCLWTLLGLVRTIFDATLFKVNANLKQVWQMSMPSELSLHVQRVLRTMISGVMLVQFFTLYVYLSLYIVLLYPVFLEERPTLVLPWLILAAVRNLLCELTSLALGLGTCVLLGPARSPCIKFLITKISYIIPAFYMWILVFSYYHTLKVASSFKTFTALPSNNHDYGLELAVRRRRTKSLFDEDQLRRKLTASLYAERQSVVNMQISNTRLMQHPTVGLTQSTTIIDESNAVMELCDMLRPFSLSSNAVISDTGYNDDLLSSDVTMPRDTDRILEQFGLMLLRISAYINKERADQVKPTYSPSVTLVPKNTIEQTIPADEENTDTPLHVGSSREGTTLYLRDYPQIFMKKPSDVPPQLNSEANVGSTNTGRNQLESNKYGNIIKKRFRKVSITPEKNLSIEVDKETSVKKFELSDITNKTRLQKTNNKVSSRSRSSALEINSRNLSHKNGCKQQENLQSESNTVGKTTTIYNNNNTGAPSTQNSNDIKEKIESSESSEEIKIQNNKDDESLKSINESVFKVSPRSSTDIRICEAYSDSSSEFTSDES